MWEFSLIRLVLSWSWIFVGWKMRAQVYKYAHRILIYKFWKYVIHFPALFDVDNRKRFVRRRLLQPLIKRWIRTLSANYYQLANRFCIKNAKDPNRPHLSVDLAVFAYSLSMKTWKYHRHNSARWYGFNHSKICYFCVMSFNFRWFLGDDNGFSSILHAPWNWVLRMCILCRINRKICIAYSFTSF